MMKYLFVILLFLSARLPAFAHAVWIETPAKGQPGKPQQVRVFFGEYSTGDRVNVKDWYSDIGALTVWITQPGKQDMPVTLTDSGGFYAGVFTPADQGIYQIVLRHPVKDLYAGKKLEYNAVATVWVNNQQPATVPAVAAVSLLLRENKLQKNSPVSLTVFSAGRPLASQEVELVAPDGTKIELVTDQNGVVTFTPPKAGRYMVEVIRRIDTTGLHHQQSYTGILKIVTMSLAVE